MKSRTTHPAKLIIRVNARVVFAVANSGASPPNPHKGLRPLTPHCKIKKHAVIPCALRSAVPLRRHGTPSVGKEAPSAAREVPCLQCTTPLRCVMRHDVVMLRMNAHGMTISF